MRFGSDPPRGARPEGRESYHHGNLREALIDAAMRADRRARRRMASARSPCARPRVALRSPHGGVTGQLVGRCAALGPAPGIPCAAHGPLALCPPAAGP